MNNTLYVNTKLFKTKLHLCYISTPKKHHFVPEVYLKRWYSPDKNNFFCKPVKKNVETPPRQRSASQVCFEWYGYKISNTDVKKHFRISDNNIIEKKAFDYENSLLDELFNQIEKREVIEPLKMIELIKVLLHLKLRNPSLRKKYNKTDYQPTESLNEELEALREWGTKQGTDLSSTNFNLDKSVDFFQKKENRTDNYKYNLLNWECPPEIFNQFINSNFTILQTNQNLSFNTSDDPVFFFNDSFIISVDDFSLSNMGCPISPNSFLILSKVDKKNNQELTITHRDATSKEVEKFNDLIYLSSKERIISTSKDNLAGYK